jgi:hypothetical protein
VNEEGLLHGHIFPLNRSHPEYVKCIMMHIIENIEGKRQHKKMHASLIHDTSLLLSKHQL